MKATVSIATLAAALLVAPTALAQDTTGSTNAGDAADFRPFIDQTYQAWDTNADDLLGEEEFWAGLFGTWDEDRDAILTQDEYERGYASWFADIDLEENTGYATMAGDVEGIDRDTFVSAVTETDLYPEWSLGEDMVDRQIHRRCWAKPSCFCLLIQLALKRLQHCTPHLFERKSLFDQDSEVLVPILEFGEQETRDKRVFRQQGQFGIYDAIQLFPQGKVRCQRSEYFRKYRASRAQENRLRQLLLGSEVVVQQRLVDVGLIGDLLRSGTGRTPPDEDAMCRFENARFSVVGVLRHVTTWFI